MFENLLKSLNDPAVETALFILGLTALTVIGKIISGIIGNKGKSSC